MTKKSAKKALSVVGLIAFFIFFLLASNEEYKETVIHSMPDAAYTAICVKLGEACTDKKIVTEYMSNRSYYDSLPE